MFELHSRHVGNAMRDLPPNSTVPWQVSCPFCSITVEINPLTSGLPLFIPNVAHHL